MSAVKVILVAGWVAFWIYWFVSAFSMKRGRVPWSREIGIRAVIAVIVIVLVRSGALRHRGTNAHLWLGAVGVVLFAVGLASAVWARVNIGRNWGMPMTEKADPELVATGPYGWVRHPIYSGILIAVLGTAVAISWVWLTAFVLAGSYFVYSAVTEERFLIRTLPDTYPEYRRSTKMFLPFII
jgi:protein-S-isoprenylcysteine O-methyltransferase Ste14